jgi:hypothetical protein
LPRAPDTVGSRTRSGSGLRQTGLAFLIVGCLRRKGGVFDPAFFFALHPLFLRKDCDAVHGTDGFSGDLCDHRDRNHQIGLASESRAGDPQIVPRLAHLWSAPWRSDGRTVISEGLEAVVGPPGTARPPAMQFALLPPPKHSTFALTGHERVARMSIRGRGGVILYSIHQITLHSIRATLA